MNRVLPWGLALAALALGVWQAPPGLFTPWSLSTLPAGERLSSVEVRWIQLEVPAESTLTAALQAWRLDAPALTFRTRCDGENLALDDVRGVTGTVWVAAGEPAPVIGPGCPGDSELPGF
jgi:hypothetical protein